MSARQFDADDAGMAWGVRHSQGIRWCSSEREARQGVADSVAADERRQRGARGKVRLVRRTVGPLEVVENPYGDGAS